MEHHHGRGEKRMAPRALDRAPSAKRTRATLCGVTEVRLEAVGQN